MLRMGWKTRGENFITHSGAEGTGRYPLKKVIDGPSKNCRSKKLCTWTTGPITMAYFKSTGNFFKALRAVGTMSHVRLPYIPYIPYGTVSKCTVSFKCKMRSRDQLNNTSFTGAPKFIHANSSTEIKPSKNNLPHIFWENICFSSGYKLEQCFLQVQNFYCILYPVPDWFSGSGSRRAKITHKKRKVKKLQVLKC